VPFPIRGEVRASYASKTARRTPETPTPREPAPIVQTNSKLSPQAPYPPLRRTQGSGSLSVGGGSEVKNLGPPPPLGVASASEIKGLSRPTDRSRIAVSIIVGSIWFRDRALRKMDKDEKRSFWTERNNLLCGLTEVFFSINIAWAVCYALTFYVVRSMTPWTPQNDSAYYFLRGAVRVADILHLGVGTPVSTGAGGRQGDAIFFKPTAIGTTFVVTVCSMAALVFLLVRASALSSRVSLIFRRAAAAVALFATPAGCLLVLVLTRKWPYGVPGDAPIRNVIFVFTGELLVFSVLFLLSFLLRHRRALFIIVSGTLLVLHYAFWNSVPHSIVLMYGRGSFGSYVIQVALWLIPCATTVCLLYMWPGPSVGCAGERKVGKWTLVPAALGLIALLAIWTPGRNKFSERPTNLGSATIELSRGRCYGPCPVYVVTVQGNGDVEYVGTSSVRIKGIQKAKVTPEQVVQIFEILGRSGFFALEDRAFSWCFDTPSVSVSVSAGGRRRRVSSDASCSGAKSGTQAKFVQATDEIDKILGSDQWVRCEGYCRD